MRVTRSRLEVVERLGDRTAAWDALVDRQPLPSAFLLSWWVDAAAGARPRLLCCMDGDELVGGAAFEVDVVGRGGRGIERVRSLGQGPLAPDHLDVVATPGRLDEVLGHVVDWLRRPGNRIVDLDGLAAGGSLAHALARHELTRVPAPYATLPTDVGAYLADRPGQIRSTVKRTAKRMSKDGASVRRVTADGADAALAALERLHDHRWAESSGFLEAWDRFRRAAAAGMRSGSVVIHEAVDADGVVVATELDVRAGRTLAFYQAGRSTEHRWRGVGSVVKATAIGWAVDEGLTQYDLLRGDEPYKADWSNGTRDVIRVRFGVGPAGRVVAAGATAWWHGRRWQAARAATRS